MPCRSFRKAPLIAASAAIALVFCGGVFAHEALAAERQAPLPVAADREAPVPVVARSGETVAVGRLNHAGYAHRRHCTFAAVSPDVAVTAAHCVAGVAADSLHLLYGYGRMTWVAEGSVAAVEPLGGDLAALCLSAVPPDTLEIGPEARIGDPVTVLGYGSPRVHLQQRAECSVWSALGGELLLDCPAARGTSGGPVLDADGRVVGVMSRSARGSSVALALPEAAAAACAAL